MVAEVLVGVDELRLPNKEEEPVVFPKRPPGLLVGVAADGVILD